MLLLRKVRNSLGGDFANGFGFKSMLRLSSSTKLSLLSNIGELSSLDF